MQSAYGLGLAFTLGVAGCASNGAGVLRGEADFSGTTRRASSSVRVGEAHVVDARVNAGAPVRLSSEDGEIVVAFGRSNHVSALARVDASSLQLLSLQPEELPEAPSAAERQAERIELEGGRFVLCWTRGSLEWGRRALAQAFNQDGSPRGAPVVISAPDVDVMGALHAITTDGRRVIATFVAASSNRFELMAVPIELADPVPAATALR
ncbi:MAG TPA: hypothetical protein VN894_12985 [Polyangiaceae bacterium]|nr:hypothetical protein [Polyangiaceae bacterium]